MVIFMEEKSIAVKKKRYQSLGEEIGNAVTHGCGAIFAIVAIVLLSIFAEGALEVIAGLIYSISMLFVYTSSCLYHAFKRDTKVKRLFRIFDHSAIFVQIAGTYAPILIMLIGGSKGIIFLIIQWVVVVSAILLRVLSKQKNTIPQVILCLILGWCGIMFIPDMYRFSIGFFWLILAGGLTYSLGIVFYGARFKYAHFVWHFFVLGGSILHYIAIFAYLFV